MSTSFHLLVDICTVRPFSRPSTSFARTTRSLWPRRTFRRRPSQHRSDSSSSLSWTSAFATRRRHSSGSSTRIGFSLRLHWHPRRVLFNRRTQDTPSPYLQTIEWIRCCYQLFQVSIGTRFSWISRISHFDRSQIEVSASKNRERSPSILRDYQLLSSNYPERSSKASLTERTLERQR